MYVALVPLDFYFPACCVAVIRVDMPWMGSKIEMFLGSVHRVKEGAGRVCVCVYRLLTSALVYTGVHEHCS